MQSVSIALQIFNGIFAFITSQAQTKRILKSQLRANAPQWIIMIIGIIVASSGTILIYDKTRRAEKKMLDSNRMLKEMSK